MHDAIITSTEDSPEGLARGVEVYKACMIDYFPNTYDWCIIPPRIELEHGYRWGKLEKYGEVL